MINMDDSSKKLHLLTKSACVQLVHEWAEKPSRSVVATDEAWAPPNSSTMEFQHLSAKSVCVQLVHEWAEKPSMAVTEAWAPSKGYGTCKLHDWYLHHMSEMDLSIVRDEIRYQIEDNMGLITEQVVIWVQCHHSINFFHDERWTDLRQYIKKLVWNRDFEIDYRATAKNILTNDKLSPVARLRFAGTYCIFEEIKDIYNSIDIDSMPYWDCMEEPFMNYWCWYILADNNSTNDNDDDDDDDYDYDDDDDDEEEEDSLPEFIRKRMMMFIMNSGKIDLWPVIEYVFDVFNTVGKWSHFECMVEVYGDKYLKDLLPKLSDKELRSKLARYTNAISTIFEKIVQYGTSNDARFVWKLCWSEMNSEEFCRVFEMLTLKSMKTANDFDNWTPLLMEIWTNAISRSRFRKSALDTALWRRIGEKFIEYAFEETNYKTNFRASRQISDPMKFIRIVLRSTEVQNRMTFFEKNFHWLILWAPFTEVDKLMRDFLECFNRDVVSLKEIIANSSEVESSLCKLLGYCEFDEFEAVLSFYSPGGVDNVVEHDVQNRLMCCKRKLMESSNGESHLCVCIYYGDWRPLYEYVKKIFSQAHITPKAFMIKLLKMGELLSYKMEKCEMNDLKECLCTVMSHTDSKLEDFKEQFKGNLFWALFDYEDPEEKIVDRARLQDFLLWIYNGNEELIDENFKQLNLLRLGFLVQLKFCIVEDSFRVTNSMKEYLEWCFATEAERKRFKRDMIYKFREYEIFDDMLTRRTYRRSMLLWFFDDDHSLIEKFMTEVFNA
ncbi:uncharacterized protein LOC135837937 [Planococcus citri]|uniref:uncharacterized protein LOC135837937 n=1 Tax=Planococcus citri TaxID=170843 RepID=UPI0031F908CB